MPHSIGAGTRLKNWLRMLGLCSVSIRRCSIGDRRRFWPDNFARDPGQHRILLSNGDSRVRQDEQCRDPLMALYHLRSPRDAISNRSHANLTGHQLASSSPVRSSMTRPGSKDHSRPVTQDASSIRTLPEVPEAGWTPCRGGYLFCT